MFLICGLDFLDNVLDPIEDDGLDYLDNVLDPIEDDGLDYLDNVLDPIEDDDLDYLDNVLDPVDDDIVQKVDTLQLCDNDDHETADANEASQKVVEPMPHGKHVSFAPPIAKTVDEDETKEFFSTLIKISRLSFAPVHKKTEKFQKYKQRMADNSNKASVNTTDQNQGKPRVVSIDAIMKSLSNERETEPFVAISTFQILRSKRGNTVEEFNAFVTDMTNAVLYFITYGTKFTGRPQYFEKMTWGSNFSYMEELIDRYSIIDKKPKFTRDITLARIANTFPFLVCLLLKEGFGRANAKRFKIARALAWSGAPCIIPKDYPQAFAKWKEWWSNFTKTIKSAQPDEKCVNFGLASTWLSQDQKKKIFNRYGIGPDGTQLIKTKSKPQDKCLVEEFGLEYFGDVSDEFSISMIQEFSNKYYKPQS